MSTQRRHDEMALDETFDEHISRPIAASLGRTFHRWGLSANQVSVVALVCGVSAGVCIAGTGLWPLLGGILLIAMVILDCADGYVARLQPPSDKPFVGRMIDGYADLGTILAVHVGMIVHLANAGLNVGGHQLSTLEIVILGVLGVASLTWTSSIVDDLKNRLKPHSADHDVDKYADMEMTWFERFLFGSWKNYVASIKRFSGAHRPGGYDVFRAAQWVGPTHHLVGVAIAAMCVAWMPTAYFTYLLVAIVPANLFMVAILARARRVQALS